MARLTLITDPEEIARVTAQKSRTPGRLRSRMTEYEGYIASMSNDEAISLEPDEGETTRGIALRLSRAAQRTGAAIHTWVVDGVVYASKQPDEAPTPIAERKARKPKASPAAAEEASAASA